MWDGCPRAEETSHSRRVIIMSEVKTSRKLLVSEILRGDPCYIYSQRLAERFNVEIDVTVELAVSQSDDWDWWWAASRLLTEAGYEEFSSAVHKAENARRDTLKPYTDLARRDREEAHKEYDRVLRIGADNPSSWYSYSDATYRAANAAYHEVTKVSEAALKAARDVLQGDVNKAAAETFATLYIGEDGTTDLTGNDRYYDSYYGEADYEDDTDY
jgi:hypothetical protein